MHTNTREEPNVSISDHEPTVEREPTADDGPTANDEPAVERELIAGSQPAIPSAGRPASEECG